MAEQMGYLEQLGIDRRAIGVIVVDHGSRRAQSNELLLEVAALFQQRTDYAIVEPAHMELAEPSIQTAFDRCVARGATLIVIHPYFLLPGRHWVDDIPRLSSDAAVRHPGVRFLVTAPLGLHPLMTEIMDHRIQQCLAHTVGGGDGCDACAETNACQWRPVDAFRKSRAGGNPEA